MRDTKIALDAFRLNFRFSSKILWPIFIFIGSLLEHRALAATISFVGSEEGSGGNGYSVQNWSNPGVSKVYDLGGSEKYGSSGYYQIRPTLNSSPSDVSESVSAGNNLGITAGSNPSLYSAPVFLGSITGGAGQYVNYGGYPIVRGPDGSAFYRQGSLSVSVNQGAYSTPSGSNNGYYGEAFSFAMGSGMGATFRIGVAVDTAGSGTYAPDYVSLYSSSTGTVYSSKLARNGSMDMAFFDVSAAAGESLSAAVWQLAGSQSIAPFGLITFDTKSYDFNVAGTNTHTNSAVLTGAAAGLNKTSTGNLVLAGSNSYEGVTTVDQGRIVLANESGLGATSGGTVVASGAQLRLNPTIGGLNVGNEALTLSGDGLSGSAGGALRNAAGNNTWQGKITLAADATIGTAGSTTLTLDVASGNAIESVNRNLTIDGAGTTLVNDAISLGAGGLTKIGTGIATLAAANNYSGTTAVNAGLLKVLSGGSISSSSTTVNSGGTLDVGGIAGNVQVNSGGFLKGSGSVGAFTLASGGTLTPGNSPGTLTAASAIVLGGSTYNWEISALTGAPGTTWDLFSVTGLLNMSDVTSTNKWNLVVIGDSGFAGWTDTSSYSYVFAQAASVSGFSSTVGTDVTSLFNITTSGIASKPNASFNANGDFKVVVGSANGFTTLNLMAVPEPSTSSMMGLGLAGLVVTRLLRRKIS